MHAYSLWVLSVWGSLTNVAVFPVLMLFSGTERIRMGMRQEQRWPVSLCNHVPLFLSGLFRRALSRACSTDFHLKTLTKHPLWGGFGPHGQGTLSPLDCAVLHFVYHEATAVETYCFLSASPSLVSFSNV